MDRRHFIQLGSMATVIPAIGVGNSTTSWNLYETKKGISTFPLAEATIPMLQNFMEEGKYSAEEITHLYLQRIADIDSANIALNSVITTNPEAIDQAKKLDDERKQNKIRSSLHGIPVLLKDNIDTVDMATTGGSYALEGSLPSRNAFIVKRLKEAGAIILGKTNLSEWANFRSVNSTSGWSGIGGQTKNPYALNRNPCGSSSGSAVAVAANLCAVAIGTETDGSIVCPSAINGIVGIKPTVGTVSRSGIIPISISQDTAGPMARTLEDAAIVLEVISFPDKSDPAYKNGYQFKANSTKSKGNARIGVCRHFTGYHKKVDEIFEDAVSRFKELGYDTIDLPDFKPHSELGGAEWTVLLYEFKAGIADYLEKLPQSNMKNLSDLIAFNKQHAEKELQWFGQEIFEMANEKGGLDEEEYRKAKQKCIKFSRDEGIDKIMEEHFLDALVAPTTSPAWSTDLVNGDHYLGGSSTLAAVSGYPNITVPAGFAHGLPVGISVFGKSLSENTLLGIAINFEKKTKARKTPGFNPFI